MSNIAPNLYCGWYQAEREFLAISDCLIALTEYFDAYRNLVALINQSSVLPFFVDSTVTYWPEIYKVTPSKNLP